MRIKKASNATNKIEMKIISLYFKNFEWRVNELGLILIENSPLFFLEKWKTFPSTAIPRKLPIKNDF